MAADTTMAIFVAELIALLFCGRLLGEAMSRLGQPAIFGQLLAGVLLGPSVSGSAGSSGSECPGERARARRSCGSNAGGGPVREGIPAPRMAARMRANSVAMPPP